MADLKIVLATDGSDGARVAGEFLSALPLPAGTRISVLSAISGSNWLDTAMLSYRLAEEEAAARVSAEEAAAPLRQRDLRVDVRIPRRDAAAAILEEAEAEGADLVVLGSHGKGAIQRFLLGSVSERVARYAPCSVLVSRRPGAGLPSAPSAVPALRRVIVAVDGSVSSEYALDALDRLPLPRDVELKVLTVIPPSELREPVFLIPPPGFDRVIEEYEDRLREMAERIVGHAQERRRAAGYPAAASIRYGTPAEQIVAAAQEWDADLLIVGSENRSALGRLFLGSVSGRVLSHAPCSVLIGRTGNRPSEPSETGTFCSILMNR